MKFIIGLLLTLAIGMPVLRWLARPRFHSGDPISIRQCTRGYWYQYDYGKYKQDRFACTHYHVTLTRMQ